MARLTERGSGARFLIPALLAVLPSLFLFWQGAADRPFSYARIAAAAYRLEAAQNLLVRTFLEAGGAARVRDMEPVSA